MPARYAVDRDDSPLLVAALRAHRAGDLGAAITAYRARLQAQPACLDAWMNLGAAQALAGRALEAVEALLRATELAPMDARVLRDVGLGLRTVGRLAEAAVSLERSVECDPSLVGSWLHLARIRLELTERPLAIAAAQRAVDLRPEDPSSLFLLARCLFTDQDPRPCLEALARASSGAQGFGEADVFRWLLEQRLHLQALPPAPELIDAHPDLAHLIDAAVFICNEMPGARVFSSARDTLRYAAQQAPALGATVELGVFHGVSLRWLAECRPGALHGFDSFVGLPSEWAPVPAGRFTTAGRAPVDIDAQFWVGRFDEQLPRFVAQHDGPVTLLHIDSDLYESARCGLRHLTPLLGRGSVIVFDEYFGHRSWRQDEYRAFQEAARDNEWTYEYLAVNPFTGQVVIRLGGH